MFPMRSGRSLSAPDTQQVFCQSVTASAMHEIGKQAIRDVSLLLFHQLAAEYYYRTDERISIPVDSNGKYVIYSPEEESTIKQQLINIVMKFHILSENGVGHKLTPLINALFKNEPIPVHLQNDPFLNAVIVGQTNFSQDIYKGSMQNVMERIVNFDSLTSQLINVASPEIEASYKDNDVPVAIYADGHIQCACEFCEGFFQSIERDFNFDTLNPLQQIMAQKYGLF